MSDETRTPNEHTVKSIFVRAHPFALTTSYEERRAEFDRFVSKIKADALREAAMELEDREHHYNDALSAALVPGETGRGNVIQSYEAILEEPYGWLRERAARIEEEA